jgi:hypothetical protein
VEVFHTENSASGFVAKDKECVKGERIKDEVSSLPLLPPCEDTVR